MCDQDASAVVTPAVVILPAEIELAVPGRASADPGSADPDSADLHRPDLEGAGLPSASPAYAALCEAVASGVPAVIADLTGTTFCDYPGFHQLVMIGRQAATGDVQLRVAMPADGSVRSWLEFLARHRLVLAYPGVEAAKTA
jgi:hypothetical protein